MRSGQTDVIKHELHAAVRANDVDRVRALLNHGVEVNAIDSDKNTALHIAAELGYENIVKELLKSPSINTTIINDNDETAIKIANRKESDNRVNLRTLMELPENKDKALLVSDSNYHVISQMILNHKRTRAQASDNVDTKPKKHNPFTKHIRKITRIDLNLGLMSPLDVLKYAIKENYAPGKAGESLHSITPEMSRIQNPLFFVNSCLTLVNIGTRVLIDKISNKFTGNAQARPLLTTIIKAVLTTPISLVQLVIGGVAEAMNLASQLLDKPISGKKAVKKNEDNHEVELSSSPKYMQLALDKNPNTTVRKRTNFSVKKLFFTRAEVRKNVELDKRTNDIELQEYNHRRPGK